MRLKSGVRILGAKPEIVLAMQIAADVYARNNHRLTVTSVVEGTHSRGSIHYQGLAFDARLPELSSRADVVAALKESLGQDFDVALEADHIHIEFQPKEAL